MKIRLKQQTTFMSGLFHFLTLTLGFLFRVMTDYVSVCDLQREKTEEVNKNNKNLKFNCI